MKDIYTSATEFQIRSKKYLIGRSHRHWTIVLYFCGFGAGFIGASGLFLSALEYFHFVSKTAHLNKIGTGLIVLAFSLIMFGAHALDRIGELKQKIWKTYSFPYSET